MTDRSSSGAPLRLALAGAGMISWHHLKSWQKLRGQVSVVAVCDPVIARAQDRAREFAIPAVFGDVDDMLSKESVDAIDIATPRESHAELVEIAARRGLAILCQKPLTPTLGEAEALTNRLPAETRLMVHENWRFRPWYRELRKWVDAGAIGMVHNAHMSSIDSGLLPNEAGRRPHLERQPFLADESRLMIAEGLIHHLDVMRYLCGPLRVVAARTRRTEKEIKGETLATIFLETATGAPVVVHGSMVSQGHSAKGQDRLQIVGSEGAVEMADGSLKLHGAAGREAKFQLADGYQASFDNAIAHFVDTLSVGGTFETSLSDNMETLRLVEDAYLAAGEVQIASK